MASLTTAAPEGSPALLLLACNWRCDHYSKHSHKVLGFEILCAQDPWADNQILFDLGLSSIMRACWTSCRACRSGLASIHINHRAPALLLSRRHPRQQQTRRQLHVQASGGRKGAQQLQMIQQAAPQPRMPPQRRSLSWFVAIPGLMLLVFMVLRIMKKMAGRG